MISNDLNYNIIVVAQKKRLIKIYLKTEVYQLSKTTNIYCEKTYVNVR